MFGLIVFSIWGAYIALSVFVIYRARRYALENCKTMSGAWALTFVAAFVMFLIPGWDYIPTMAMHSYYCRTESGIFFDKDFEVWKKENPGVLEGLVYTPDAYKDKEENTPNGGWRLTGKYNERFGVIISHEYFLRPLTIRKNQIDFIDLKTNEVIIRKVDFSTGGGTVMDEIVKPGLNSPFCSEDKQADVQKSIYIETQIKGARK